MVLSIEKKREGTSDKIKYKLLFGQQLHIKIVLQKNINIIPLIFEVVKT